MISRSRPFQNASRWGLSFAALLFLTLSGCGYHFFNLNQLAQAPAAKDLSFGKTVRIAVKTFHNMTVFPLIEATVTQSLKNALLRTSGVILINDPKRADIVLWGNVVAVVQMPLALSSINGIEEYQVEVILDAHATGYNGKELWHGGAIAGTAPMYVSLNLSLFNTTQQYAMNTAAMNATVRVINFMAHNISSASFNVLSLQNQIGGPTPGMSVPNGSAVPAPPGAAP